MKMKSEIEFASHPANLALARDFVRQFLKPLSFSETEKDLIVLGLDEACTNIIRYAYHHEPNELIVLVCELLDEGVRFSLRDYGTQCSADQLHGRPLELIQPGGLGIHHIRRAFSQVDYNLKKEGTELVLEKHFNHTTGR